MTIPSLLTRGGATLALTIAIATQSAAAGTSTPGSGGVAADVAPCAAQRLVLHADAQGGRFTWMSHGGSVLTVRNVGDTACRIGGLAELTLRDANGRTVATGSPSGARFMHPGPVVLPVVLQPGVVAATTLRWVTGPVYETNTKATSTTVALATDDGTVTTPLATTLYGPTSLPTFERGRFTTELPPLGAATSARDAVAGRWYGSGPEGATLLDAEGRPAHVLTLGAVATRRTFAFDLETGGATPNLGAIAGTLAAKTTHATFVDRSRDCTLGFTFYGDQIVVTQSGSCGFGNGVSAAGRYTAAD